MRGNIPIYHPITPVSDAIAVVFLLKKMTFSCSNIRINSGNINIKTGH